jgi:hypothetical protein
LSEDNRALLKEAGAIPVLLGLMKRTPCRDVEQAVVTALSNLSESASCKVHITSHHTPTHTALPPSEGMHAIAIAHSPRVTARRD